MNGGPEADVPATALSGDDDDEATGVQGPHGPASCPGYSWAVLGSLVVPAESEVSWATGGTGAASPDCSAV